MAAEKAKQVRIFISRNITLERDGKPAVKMTKGANLVDTDVAEHPFVKAHYADGTEAEAADAALQAKVAELLAENAELRKANNELQAMVDAYAATSNAPAGKGK